MLFPSRSKVVLLCLILLTLLYIVNYFVTPNLIGVTKLEEQCRPSGALKFDSGVWKQAAPSSGKRFEMVDDLLASGILLNLDTTQISLLLGDADFVTDEQGEIQLVYVLGDQRDFPASSVFFPGLFANLDCWMLELRLRNGKLYYAGVFFT